MVDNMSSAAQVALFFLAAYAIVASLGDSWTTALGLSGGMEEMNPINKFLFAKIGQPLTTFLEIVAIIITSMLMSMESPTGSFIYLGVIAALETSMVIRNYLLLKKAKIPFSWPF